MGAVARFRLRESRFVLDKNFPNFPSFFDGSLDLILRTRDRFTGRFAVGQNIARSWTTRPPGPYDAEPNWRRQISGWFNEVQYYHSGYSKATGHYTQVCVTEAKLEKSELRLTCHLTVIRARALLYYRRIAVFVQEEKNEEDSFHFFLDEPENFSTFAIANPRENTAKFASEAAVILSTDYQRNQQ